MGKNTSNHSAAKHLTQASQLQASQQTTSHGVAVESLTYRLGGFQLPLQRQGIGPGHVDAIDLRTHHDLKPSRTGSNKQETYMFKRETMDPHIEVAFWGMCGVYVNV